MTMASLCPSLFFSNDTGTTECYTLSLHDALPISLRRRGQSQRENARDPSPTNTGRRPRPCPSLRVRDRKSTRLNSSHPSTSYAVVCLKKKKQHTSPNYNNNSTLHVEPYVRSTRTN